MSQEHQKANYFRNFSFLLASALAFMIPSTTSAFDLMQSLGLKKVDPTELVDLQVEYAPKKCSEKHPMLARINNGSDETIQSLYFNILGTRKDHSTLLYAGFGFESDRIISPSEGYSACWRAPEPTLDGRQYPIETILWEPKITNIYFED